MENMKFIESINSNYGGKINWFCPCEDEYTRKDFHISKISYTDVSSLKTFSNKIMARVLVTVSCKSL